ncbi:hypothetical protein BS78_05G007900 [Paspalum vaginatum]|nr:hypothetical protein BS78_05G007900 [Paspalum vaginatum]
MLLSRIPPPAEAQLWQVWKARTQLMMCGRGEKRFSFTRRIYEKCGERGHWNSLHQQIVISMYMIWI